MEIEIVSPRTFLASLGIALGLAVGGVWWSGAAGTQALPSLTPTRRSGQAPTPTRRPTHTGETFFAPTPEPLAVPTATPTPLPDNVQPYLDGCQKGGEASFAPDYAGAFVAASCTHGGGNIPQAVVVHATGGELAGALAHLRNPHSGVSAHYVVDRDGRVYQLVPERLVAYHVACGVEGCVKSCPAFLCGDGRPESRSIGIELVNRGKVPQGWPGAVYEDFGLAFGWRWWEEYPQAQIEALRRLVADIARRWGIPLDAEHVLGHYRLQAKRDPGPALNLFWQRNGYPPRQAVFGR